MRYIKTNPNPCKKIVGDCVIRALCVAENRKWQEIYIDLCMQGLEMCDMPSSNSVWKAYLCRKGYIMQPITAEQTVKGFADTHRYGIYVLCTGSHVVSHVVTVIGGNYYDTWDSGDETPLFYLYKESDI